jgi:hypothetical protein
MDVWNELAREIARCTSSLDRMLMLGLFGVFAEAILHVLCMILGIWVLLVLKVSAL